MRALRWTGPSERNAWWCLCTPALGRTPRTGKRMRPERSTLSSGGPMRLQRARKSVGGGVLGRAASSVSACGSAVCSLGASMVMRVGAFMTRQLRGVSAGRVRGVVYLPAEKCTPQNGGTSGAVVFGAPKKNCKCPLLAFWREIRFTPSAWGHFRAKMNNRKCTFFRALENPVSKKHPRPSISVFTGQKGRNCATTISTLVRPGRLSYCQQRSVSNPSATRSTDSFASGCIMRK